MKYLTMQSGSAFVMATMLLSMLAISVIAADQHGMLPVLSIGNTPPEITSMVIGAGSYDPTESANTTVTINMNVSDVNGVADLDDSLVYVNIDDAATFVTAVGKYTRLCTPTVNWSATVREYQCVTDLEFYDLAGTFSTNMTAGDSNGTVWNNTATNAPTFTYTTLVASTIDTTTINFNGVTLGQNNAPAVDNPSVLTNTGNANLVMNITGADMTGTVFADTIGVGNFSVSLDSTPTAEMVLTTGTQQIIVGAVNATAPAGASSTENLYWYVDVPASLQPDSYTGSWTLGTYEL